MGFGLHRAAQHVDGQRIAPALARLVNQRHAAQPFEVFGQTDVHVQPVRYFGTCVRAVPVFHEAVAESAGVGDQLLDGDGGATRFCCLCLRRLGCLGGSGPEIRQPAGDGGLQRQPAFFFQPHGGGGHHWLGDRGQAENGVRLHRFFCFPVGPAGRTLVDELAVVGHQHDGTDDAFFLHRLGDDGVEGIERWGGGMVGRHHGGAPSVSVSRSDSQDCSSSAAFRRLRKVCRVCGWGSRREADLPAADPFGFVWNNHIDRSGNLRHRSG